MRRLSTLLLAGLLLTACGAATGLPRYYTTNPKTAIRDAENADDGYPSGRFSNARCWLSGGTRQDGWRHEVCVGNYKYYPETYLRYRIVSTPRSCTRFQEILTVPGLHIRKNVSFAWHDRVFTCKR
jgi:hypothetical protein